MSFGQIRQRLPRARLALPGRDGPLTIEFVVDTGFDGELAVPPAANNGHFGYAEFGPGLTSLTGVRKLSPLWYNLLRRLGMTAATQGRQPVTAQARRRAALRRIQSAWRAALEQSPADDLERLADRVEQAVQHGAGPDPSRLADALAGGRRFAPAACLALELENQERLFRRRQELLADALTAPQVARLLQVSRQTPHDRARAGTLLAVPDRGASRFPAWQFDPNGTGGVLAGLPEVLGALAVPPLAQVGWLVRPNAAFDGQSPLEVLRAGEAARVVAEAHAVGVS